VVFFPISSNAVCAIQWTLELDYYAPRSYADAREPSEEVMHVLIIDDHPIVIAGCRALLWDVQEMVISEAADAEGGVASFSAEPPDVCVIDINLPGVSGFELARRILKRDPAARIVMFSMNDDPVFAARAIEAGAKGYVSKSGDPNDLISAIHEVGKGGVFLPPSIAKSLAFAGARRNQLALLALREIEILRLIRTGKSLSEIASLMKLSYKTVADTSATIRGKLGVHSSQQLIRLAIESKVI
jgi:two-component system, NarL family, invasion response regulator UvrY